MAIRHALSSEMHFSDLELLVELICKKSLFQDTKISDSRQKNKEGI